MMSTPSWNSTAANSSLSAHDHPGMKYRSYCAQRVTLGRNDSKFSRAVITQCRRTLRMFRRVQVSQPREIDYRTRLK